MASTVRYRIDKRTDTLYLIEFLVGKEVIGCATARTREQANKDGAEITADFQGYVNQKWGAR